MEKKIYYFLGSSVTYGFANNGKSFVEVIEKNLKCHCVKEAENGTTLTDDDSTSYVERLENKLDKKEKIEGIIVQFSTNDISKNKPLGEVSSSLEKDAFDKKTVLGAIEYIIAYCKEIWNCSVIFYTNPNFNNKKYDFLIDKLYEIKRKWNIEIIDFYNFENMEKLDDDTLKKYMADDIHPNNDGYLWMGNIMAEYLKQKNK